jgi:hypothetical protein
MGKRVRETIGRQNENPQRRATIFQRENWRASLYCPRRTNVGAGIRAQDLKILPLSFALSFDNFRTVRMCRLIWRQGDFLGVAFES